MEYTAAVPDVATTTRVVSKRQCSPKSFNSSQEGWTTRYSPGTAGSKPAHAAFRAQASGLVRSDWSETANRFHQRNSEPSVLSFGLTDQIIESDLIKMRSRERLIKPLERGA